MVQDSGTQPAFTQTPAVQASPVAQAPQSSFMPQPSPTMPQYFAAPPPGVQVIRWQLGPPTQRPALHTLSPPHMPHSSEPPLQPLPILPQYCPPAGMQLTRGVHAASLLPASVAITTVPPVPARPIVPLWPASAPVPAAPEVAPPVPVSAPGITFAQPSDAATKAPSRLGPSRRIGTLVGLSAGGQTARLEAFPVRRRDPGPQRIARRATTMPAAAAAHARPTATGWRVMNRDARSAGEYRRAATSWPLANRFRSSASSNADG